MTETLLSPDTPERDLPRDALPLERRGCLHGYVLPAEPGDAPSDEPPADAWQRGAPIPLPGVLDQGIDVLRAEIDATLAMFDRLRNGARWLDECDARIAEDETTFRYSSSTVDHADRREIERLFVDVLGPDGTRTARDITARLSWIADDEADLSLRVRFSFGHESLREWLDVDDPRSDLADAFAELAFPECALLTHPELLRMVGESHGGDVRLTERIVYSNAPGGGAMFHHDADPNQRGVVFGQLAGMTAWLALPRAELAEAVEAYAPEVHDADRALEDIDESLWTILNRTPEFTAALAERGALRVMHPGDVLLLPSPDPSRAAWHSVFTLGDAPNLALSFGVFDVRGH